MTYLHCSRCIRDAMKLQVPPRDYARLEVALTTHGLLINCKRHDAPVTTITPDQLREWIAHPPGCEMCRLGIHHEH